MEKKRIQIVEDYAPIVAHKVTKEWSAADHITRVDLLGDIKRISENPQYLIENTTNSGDWKGSRPEAAIYYSVCETETHYFLLYAAYHPMDWWKRLKPTNLYDLIRDGVDEHAHDLEGALMVIRKDPQPVLDALVTVAHHDFFLYTEAQVPNTKGGSTLWTKKCFKVQRFNETIDGKIWIDRATNHPKVYVQSRGHGMYGDHKHWGGGDEVCYYYPNCLKKKPKPIKPQDKSKYCSYKMIDICAPGGLWDHRYNRKVFRQRDDGKWGITAKKKVTEGNLVAAAANPPWSWNDRIDPSPMGEIATDPARFIGRYAQGLGPLSHNYIFNPNLQIVLTSDIERVK